MTRTERLTALVEAAIEYLEEGDLSGAKQKLAQAARIDPQDPDLLTVQASLAMIEGDLDRALELSAKAVERAPEDAHVLIAAADIALATEPERAVDYARRASEVVDEEEDLVNAILLLSEALVATDRPEEAREALSELATSAIDEPGTIIDVANAFIAAEDPTTAELWLRRAIDGDDELAADAWHGIGQCREAKGDHDGMVAAWLETRRRDAALPPAEGAGALSDDQLEEIASEALEALPAQVRDRLANVPILIDDLPSEHLVKDGWDPRLLGIFEGTPMPDQTTVGGAPSVTTIHLYRRNLERLAEGDTDLLAEEIRVTVLHETAHYFGLDDDDLEKIGLD
ncbi:MAG TPA: metallopeptidase family protein [Kofleriaceae bacterium]|nr:metallopeptidase family protein [Kofleriaceae bacterium]